MKKLTYRELAAHFRAHEAARPAAHLTGFIVFTEDSFEKSYPLESRTYAVSSGCKAYMPNMGGYSIFGYCLDGTDPGVRLDGYMAEEKAGKDGWKVEYCYLEEDGKEGKS